MAKNARRSREYWDKKRRSRAQEKHEAERERLTRTVPAPTQGLHLPSEPQGKTYLMEAEDGTLVSVPEDRLDNWIEMQGQEEVSQEQIEAEGRVLERVMEMLYGEAEQDS